MSKNRVSEAMTEKMAQLSRLSLTANERVEFTIQLERVLEYFEALTMLDTSSTEPLIYPSLIDVGTEGLAARADVSFVSPLVDSNVPATIAAAPESLEHQFIVPKVV